MKVQGELTDAKNKVLDAIAQAVERSDTSDIARLARLLESIERDQETLDVIQHHLSDYRAALTNGSKAASAAAPPDPGGPSFRPEPTRLNRKKRAEEVRKAFAGTHRLQQVKGITYLSQSRRLTAIVTATEDRRGSRWG